MHTPYDGITPENAENKRQKRNWPKRWLLAYLQRGRISLRIRRRTEKVSMLGSQAAERKRRILE